MIIVVFGLLPPVFGQSQNLSSVLEKAQNALTSQNNPNSTTSEHTTPTYQSRPFQNTEKGLILPPDTRVTDIFHVHVSELHGDNILVSVSVPGTSSRLEEIGGGDQNVTIPFFFYAGFAPLGTPVDVCVKNLSNNRANCQSLTHTINPELVEIVSP